MKNNAKLALLFAAAPGLVLIQTPKGLETAAPVGHHFNLKAPHHIKLNGKKLKLTEKSVATLSADTTQSGNADVLAYLCDEANTYCVKRQATLVIVGNQDAPITAPQHAETKTDVHAKAFARAHTEKKPMFIGFFAIWCPPCNTLDATVFNTIDYKNLSKKFVSIKVDVDSESSWALKERYKVGGYPTVVFTDSEGNETSRIVGSLKPKAFLEIMSLAADGKKPTAVADISELPDSSKDSPEDVIKKSKLLLSKPMAENQEVQATDLWQMIGEAEKTLKHEDAARSAYKECAHAYQAELRTLGKASNFNRGYNLELAYCLAEAGLTGDADALYQRLERRYPKEFTFHYARGRMYQRQKRFDEALPLIKEAHKFSYGDNRLRASLALAEITAALGNQTLAIKTASTALVEAKVPADKENRTHRYLKQLREFSEKLTSN